MVTEELHDIVDVEKIEPMSVHISESPGGEAAGKHYTARFRLPIKVSKTWQDLFHKPDVMSGVVHLVRFEFSEDGQEVFTKLDHEPPAELRYVLKRYVERANTSWKKHRQALLEKSESD